MTSALLRARERAWVVICSVLVIFLTWQVTTDGFVVRLDERVHSSVGSALSPWSDLVSDIGSAEISGVVLAVAAVHTAFTRGYWWPVVLAVGNGIGISLVVLAMKTAVSRLGPGLEPLDGYPGYFPSGHTSAAAVCLGTACYILAAVRRLPRRPRRRMHPASDAARLGLAGGLAAGTVVGAMTVVSGNHWVSDVVAALALSAVVLVVGFAAIRQHFERE